MKRKLILLLSTVLITAAVIVLAKSPAADPKFTFARCMVLW